MQEVVSNDANISSVNSIMPCYMAKVGDWTIRYGWSFFNEKLIDGDIDHHKRLDLIDLEK